MDLFNFTMADSGKRLAVVAEKIVAIEEHSDTESILQLSSGDNFKVKGGCEELIARLRGRPFDAAEAMNQAVAEAAASTVQGLGATDAILNAGTEAQHDSGATPAAGVAPAAAQPQA